MRSSSQMLQLLQGASPLTTHAPAAAAATSVLRRLAPAELYGLLDSQIRRFGADALPTSDRQDAAPSNSDAGAAAPATAAAGAAETGSSDSPTDAAAGAARLQRKRAAHVKHVQSKEGALKLAGLWVPPAVYKSLSQQQKDQLLQWQKRYQQQRQLHKPLRALHMSAVALNPHQLQVVVALATDAAAGNGDSSSTTTTTSSSSSQETGVAVAAAAADDDAELLQASSSNSSSSTSSRAVQQLQHHHHQRQRGHQQQQQGVEPLNPLGYEFLSQPRLDKQSFVSATSGEQLIINLNSQMRMASAINDYAQVVSLFDSLLAKGIAIAEEAAQAAGEQQQQQQQRRRRLVLPLQYRPDTVSLTMYCRALVGLADAEERGQAPEARDRSRADRFRPQQCSVERAEQAVVLLGSSSMRAHGVPAYLALLSAYRLAEQHSKGLEAFQALRAANPPEEFNRHYRLHVAGCIAAIRAQDYAAANELARVFSTRQVAYREFDYRARVVKLYRSLVRGAAASCKWEDAIYWLQELINNQSLVPVSAEAFLSVMMPAAAAGRMDVVRTMMGAVDQHLALQGSKPLVYHADDLVAIIKAAGTAGDTALVADAWARLLNDVQHTPTTDSLSTRSGGTAGQHGRHSAIAQAFAVDPTPGKPSPAAFKAVVKAYLDAREFDKALQLVADLEQVYGGTPAASVYGGLAFLPCELKREEDIAAMFTQLKARKDADKPVTTAMMNILCRAIGRLGNTEVTGKVFESYGAWGLEPDADSYNTVMESCEQAKKVAAVEGLISYMASKGVQPNIHSWNLLLSAAAEAKDCSAVASAVQRMLGSGVLLSKANAEKVLRLAHEQRNEKLLQLIRQADQQQGLGMKPAAFAGSWRERRSSGGIGAQRGQHADVWQLGMQRREQDQQGQGKLQQMLEHQEGSDSDERKSVRAGLQAALGAAMGE